MTIEEAQKKVDGWIRKYGVRYFSELTNMAVLTEEVGEVARIMSRRYGDQSFKEGEDPDALADELADVFWVLVCIANQTGVDLTAAFEKNLAANVENRTVHHPRIIVEYAQTERFFHQPFHIVGSVVVLHADKYHHARTYGRLKHPANRDRRLANSLYNNSHNSANLRKILDYRLLAHFF